MPPLRPCLTVGVPPLAVAHASRIEVLVPPLLGVACLQRRGCVLLCRLVPPEQGGSCLQLVCVPPLGCSCSSAEELVLHLERARGCGCGNKRERERD